MAGQPGPDGGLSGYQSYTWIYGQVLARPGWFARTLQRHGLRVPRQPPVPRRYFGGQ